MKALSLWQPWASLLVHGLKKVETRGWRPETLTGPKVREAEIGRCLIHASKKIIVPPPEVRLALIMRLGVNGADDFLLRKIPRGVIVGSVRFENYIRFTHLTVVDVIERAFGDFTPGRWGWIASFPKVYEEPIPAKGAMGIWEFHGEVPE